MTDSDSATTYVQTRKNIQATSAAFEALANKLAEREEFAHLCDKARKHAATLAANRFRIMIVGEFKRSKSTMLNALLGAQVLPAKPTPCTAIITHIRHGEKPEISVIFSGENLNEENLSLEDFEEKYALKVQDARSIDKDSNNDVNRQISDRFGHIDHAVIRYPSMLLENGIELIDTPGLEEHEARTERVLKNLSNAAAVIMVLDATQLGTQNEKSFIMNYLQPLDLHRHTFFLINRWNMLRDTAFNPDDPEELDKILNHQNHFIEKTLYPFIVNTNENSLIDNRIFKINALGALRHRANVKSAPDLDETGIPAFERALQEFLTVDRDNVRRNNDIVTAERIEQQVEKDINLFIQKIRVPIVDFDLEQKKFDEQINRLKRISINIDHTFKAFSSRVAKLQGDSLEGYLEKELFERLNEHVDKFDWSLLQSSLSKFKMLGDSFRDDENKISKKIGKHLQQQTAKLFGKCIGEWKRDRLEPALKDSTKELTKTLEYEVGEYIAIVSEISGNKPHPVSGVEINQKIQEWLVDRHFTLDETSNLVPAMGVTMLVGGVSIMLSAATAISASILAIIILPLAWLWFELDVFKENAKKQIVNTLMHNKETLVLKQKNNVRDVIENFFKTLSDQISQSIEKEIATIQTNLTDVLQKRQDANFNADAYEKELKTFSNNIKKQVAAIRQLVV